MWLRTALILFLVLLAWRILRDVMARISQDSQSSKVAQDPSHGAPGSRGGARPSGPSGAIWPPGEIIDVKYRESHPDEGGPR